MTGDATLGAIAPRASSGATAPTLASPLARPDPASALLPLQTTTGGSPSVVLAAFAALFLATALSLYLVVRLYRGYRQTGGRASLWLAVGLVLLTTAPILIRLVTSNVPGVPPTTRAILATLSQLVGLLVILEVVYDG